MRLLPVKPDVKYAQVVRPGQQLPFKEQVDVSWGHPSLTVVVLAAVESPVPQAVRRYLERVPAGRARSEIVTGLGLSEPKLVLTDAWGEVFACWGEGPWSWPEATELAEWIDYIATQCPECSPLEDRWRGETT